VLRDLSLVDLLRDVPRPGAKRVGDLRPDRGIRAASERPEDGGSAAANADGDRVEISGRGHRLQVEAQVRAAVVSDLRRLAGELPAAVDGMA
jgi:hypothetical protein